MEERDTLAKVKVAFKNVLDKRAVYKPIEKVYLIAAVREYARVYCEDPDLYKVLMQQRIRIRLNGKVVEVDDWSSTLLLDDDKILIVPVIEGDLLGGAGFIGIIIGAILIGVSAIFTGGATLALAGILFNQTLFLMGAAMIVGGLMSVLMQPDLPTLSTAGGLGGKGSTTYSWSGISTQANPQTPLPIVYGKHIIGGNLIGVFTEREGADDFLYMLIAMCEGEIEGICTEENTDNICTTSNQSSAAYKHPYITLDDQPFQNYTDIEWWYRKGTNIGNSSKGQYNPTVQNIIPHFNGSRMQIDDGRPLTKAGVVYTTTKECDMARVQIRFPSLFNATGGSVSAYSVTYGVEYRKNGDSTWRAITKGKYVPTVTPRRRSNGVMSPNRGITALYNSRVPGIQSGGAFALTENKADSIHIECGQVVSSRFVAHEDMTYGSQRGMVHRKIELTIKNLTTNEVWHEYITKKRWGINLQYGDIYNPTPRVREYGTPLFSGFRMTLGPYDVSIPSGMAAGDRYLIRSIRQGIYWRTINDKSKTGLWDTVHLNFHDLEFGEGKQIYDIRVKRQTEISTDFNISDQAILNSVVEIINGDFVYPNTALLGLRIRATNQMSGSPPNINVMLKGTKISVPDHSGSENFEELFWDKDNERWEYNGAERTWDNSTYTKEYSNNSMLCLKDLMTNKIYGLGEYTNDNDFSDVNTISIMRECHIEYNPTENDYLKWWGAGNTVEFVKNIEDGLAGNWENTLTINSGVPSVTYAGAYSHWLPVRLDAPLKGGQSYRFSITLSGTDANVDIDLSTKRGDWKATSNTSWYQIGDYTAPEIGDKGNGTHTYDFIAPYTGIIGLIINIKKTGEARNISGIITDISLDSIQGTGANRAWHYHTFNGVFDNQQAALTTLLELAQSFRVWPSWYEGTFQFIMDKDETPIHTIAISNTKTFAQSFTPISEIPYRIVGQFTDEDHKFDLTQIMVQSSDDNVPKSNKQTVGLKGITNRKRAERELKFKLTKFTNSTHSISITCGMDMIHATAGDIVNVSNDLPQWGHGARIASYNEANKYIYLTEPYTITDATPADLVIKYQDTNNDFQTASIDVSGISDNDTVRRVTIKSWPANPNVNGPVIAGKSTTYVKKFRLLSVTRTGEEEVTANAIEHLDTIYGDEPTLVVNQDYETKELDAALGPPGRPVNINLTRLLPTEGIGWDISAEHADLRSQEIVVMMGEGLNSTSYEQIGAILQGQKYMRYINNNLKEDEHYSFRIYARNSKGISAGVYETVYFEKLTFAIEPPTGLVIKGSDALSQTWDGLDVTISWNPIGQNWYKTGMMDFYTVYLYHTSYDPLQPNNNLLRIAYPKKTEYRYTYDMNVEDNGVNNVKGTLIFVITANLINGVESGRGRPFRVANAAPNTPQNFTSTVSLRTVNFDWSPNTDTDFKTFRYRSHFKGSIGSPIGDWTSWVDTKADDVPIPVNGTSIGIYGNQTRVFFEVKTLDIYNGSSTIASGNNITESLGVTIGTQTIASWMLENDAIVNVKLAASAITSRTVATGAITSEAIVAGAIVTDKLFASAVAANKIQTGAILAAKIAANAVIADKIQANAVSAAKINVATLSAIAGNMGVLTAGIAKSSDGRLLVDFDNKFIKIFDAASALRVQIGSIG